VAYLTCVSRALHNLQCGLISRIFLTLILFISLPVHSAWTQPGDVISGLHSLDSPKYNHTSHSSESALTGSQAAGNTNLAQVPLPVLEEEFLEEEKEADDIEKPVEPITRAVPIWGEAVREKGFDLPLPFGAGVNLVLMSQNVDLRNVKVGFGGPVVEVEGVNFSDAQTHDAAVTARLDMWLLPFANIYGIFGSINGEAELDLDIGGVVGGLPPIGLPPIFEPGSTIDLNIDYNGITFGGGITLAGGYKNFFASVDANYTYSKVDVVEGDIRVYTITPRIGMLYDPVSVPGSLAAWIGGMYMRYRQTVTDDINLQEFDPRLPSVEIDFELDIKNEHPWNFIFGGQWSINKRWQFMAEGGVGDRNQLITSLFFRF
jgi:hypothetical protein